MKEDDLVRLYQRGTAARRSADRAECVAPEALLAVVEHRGPEAVRLETINHAAACADCAEELELLRASRVVRDRARMSSAGLALAASLVLAAGLGYYSFARSRAGVVTDDADLTRGAATDVQLVSPGASTPRLDTLVWRSATSATSYAIELRRDDGSLVTRAITADTLLVLPDSARVVPGATVYWTVSARLADGTELRSATRRVRLTTQ